MATAAAMLEDAFATSAKRSETKTPAIRHTGIEDLVLDGYAVDLSVANAFTDGSIERTIEGASNLTLNFHDPSGDLLKSKMLQRHLTKRMPQIVLDDLRFHLMSVEKQNDDLVLTFEDRQVALLRRYKTARKSYRDKVTRAEWVLSLVREVKEERIRVKIPELHKRQPITNSRQRVTRTERQEDRKAGLAPNEKLRGKGPGFLTPYQLHNAERMLDVSIDVRASYKAQLALLCAGIVEPPDFANPTGGDSSSAGILQLLNTWLGGSTSTKGGRRDIELVSRMFLTQGFYGQGGAMQIAKAHPTWSPGRIAQNVQGSAHPERYDQYLENAKAILDAYQGGLPRGGGTVERTRVKRFPFTRKKGETSWDAIQKAAEEVNWRAFVDRGVFYYISEEDLFRSAVRFRFSEGTDGVERINFTIDRGLKVQEVTVQARASRWAVPPGSVVEIEDTGPADGKWLVHSVLKPSFRDAAVEITLKKPMADKPEPAAETETYTAGREKAAKEAGGDGVYDKVYNEAVSISNKNYQYSWGGGHGTIGVPSGPKNGFDCSGYVSACLHAGGLLDAPLTSGLLAGWGKPGVGKHFTVYANGNHVFIEFYGRKWKRADTGGGPPSGPHVRSSHRDHSGFVARHAHGQ